MALALSLSVLERNDSKLITFTDTSTGWGTDGDPAVTVLAAKTSNTYCITMDIIVNTPTEVITFDQIDLYTLSGPFTTQSDLVFEIDYSTLLASGSTVYASTDTLPDGVWDITYKVQYYTGGVWTDIDVLSTSLFICGDIQTRIYNRLRQLPFLYENNNLSLRSVQDPQVFAAFLNSAKKSAYTAQKEWLLNILQTIEKMMLNGSNYPW